MMERILRGEWFTPSFYFRPYGHGFAFSVYWNWRHYEETHGLPITPWHNAALNDFVF
jgi:hypothetical protein